MAGFCSTAFLQVALVWGISKKISCPLSRAKQRILSVLSWLGIWITARAGLVRTAASTTSSSIKSARRVLKSIGSDLATAMAISLS